MKKFLFVHMLLFFYMVSSGQSTYQSFTQVNNTMNAAGWIESPVISNYTPSFPIQNCQLHFYQKPGTNDLWVVYAYYSQGDIPPAAENSCDKKLVLTPNGDNPPIVSCEGAGKECTVREITLPSGQKVKGDIVVCGN
jgi:hypothetical protein